MTQELYTRQQIVRKLKRLRDKFDEISVGARWAYDEAIAAFQPAKEK